MPLDVDVFRKSLLEPEDRTPEQRPPDSRTPKVYDLDAFRDSLKRDYRN